MAARTQIVEAVAKEGGVSGYASSLKLICYPEIFFQRVLREKDVPLFSMVTTLGTASMRVTNERFLAGMKAELIAKDMVKQEDDVQAEFSYLDFKHTPFEDLLKQKSILGKGGFTLTVRAGRKFVSATFEPTVDFDGEWYLSIMHQLHATDTEDDIFLPLGFRPDQIVNDDPSGIQRVLFDFFARKFRELNPVEQKG